MYCYFENGKGDVNTWTFLGGYYFECDTRTRTWTSHESFVNETCNRKLIKHKRTLDVCLQLKQEFGGRIGVVM